MTTSVQHHKLTVQISFPQVYPNGEVAELLPTVRLLNPNTNKNQFF